MHCSLGANRHHINELVKRWRWINLSAFFPTQVLSCPVTPCVGNLAVVEVVCVGGGQMK